MDGGATRDVPYAPGLMIDNLSRVITLEGDFRDVTRIHGDARGCSQENLDVPRVGVHEDGHWMLADPVVDDPQIGGQRVGVCGCELLQGHADHEVVPN